MKPRAIGSSRAGATLGVLLVGCGGTVVFEEGGADGSGGQGGEGVLASASTGPVTSVGPTAATTTGASTTGGSGGGGSGAGGSGGGGSPDPLTASCERFCVAYGVPCSTFEGDCVRDCIAVVRTLGCEREWIGVLGCLVEPDVTCEDVDACAWPIGVWNDCIEG